jgi:RNA polymerase sigma-70 factor (ECF subfamily)
MPLAEPDTAELLRRSAAGDRSARGPLLQRQRTRLKRMVAARMDPRLAARVDPSDVVQEALAEADRRLDDYLRRRPLPFYCWLRQLAWEKLLDEHRRHVRAARRSVTREEEALGLPDGSVLRLAERLLDPGTGPSAALRQRELSERVRSALRALSEPEREVLVLRYIEQLSAREVGEVLSLSEAAAKKRALRALQSLRDALGDESEGGYR